MKTDPISQSATSAQIWAQRFLVSEPKRSVIASFTATRHVKSTCRFGQHISPLFCGAHISNEHGLVHIGSLK